MYSRYLKNLKNIGQGWTNGESLPPSIVTIKNIKAIIKYIELKYNNPKVIIGPNPKGGIGIEVDLHKNNSILAYITFLDDEIIFEIITNGYYECIEVNNINDLKSYLDYLFNKNPESENSQGKH